MRNHNDFPSRHRLTRFIINTLLGTLDPYVTGFVFTSPANDTELWDVLDLNRYPAVYQQLLGFCVP